MLPGKSMWPALAFTLLAVVMVVAGPSAQSSVSQAGPLATVQAFITANEAANLESIVSTFDEGATVFFPSNGDVPPPMRANGKNEIRQAFAVLFKMRTGPITITPRDVVVQVYGDIAVVTAHLTPLPSLPVRAPTVFPRRTFVLRRVGDAWLIVHHHASNSLLAPPEK